MGKYDQLARDLESTLRTLTTLARTAQPTENEHKRLLDELLMRLSVVETWIPPNVRLVPERTRVSNRLRQLVDDYEKRPTSASLASVAEWLDNAVLPYARSLALEESRPATAEHRTLGSPGELTGAKFGNWRLLEQIAAGGHSSVYKAENAMTGLIGCVKAIPLLPHDIAEQEERFRREARVPAEVGHPALVRVYDAELSNEFNAFFIAMELVDGVAIDIWARRRRQAEIVAVFQRILDALGKCHERGLVHRDLKPSNILIESNGSARLLDFGVTRAVGAKEQTRTGQILGTARYMSPEQARDSKRAEASSDIWSLGVILFELFTSLTVFAQPSEAEVMAALMSGDFPAPELHLPSALATIVRKCMDMNAARRFENVESLSLAIQRALGAPSGPLSPSSAPIAKQKRAVPPPEVTYSTAQADGGNQEPPLIDPTVSPYTLDIDTCDYCLAVGRWSGSRCTRCGRYRGTD